ncbi:hypothetical protein HPB51_002765 [Rhipicephalus microplus]|uniref:CCHC-type domain-containing protein n=1 Tax=Rhipicephalus microplus TaxID=6941 RepID=A0A9J6DL41_RHIMP|nr:hypothetical protein HPB51_002765 [Rhipicephalus microplus]
MDMRPENPLPNFARVGGHRATFEYRGVRRLCRRCNQEGHFRAQCDTPHCARCGVFGHRTDTCAEPCRRCGGAHASVDCTARKTYSMVVAMEVDEFSTLATALATEQPQRRLTTLRPAKRQKPNDAEDGLESHIPEKTQAQEASITMQEGRQAASQVEAPTKVCMRLEEPQEEEGSQVLPATPSYAAAAEAERVADSGEGEKRAEHSARSASGDDETEDDAASAVSSVSVEEMAVEESCLERGHCDGKDNQEDRLAVRKGSQGGRRLSLKAKTEQVTSAATCSEWWNKQDDDDDVRHGEVLQSAVGKTPSSLAEQQTSKKASGEGAPKRTEPSSPSRRQQPSEPAPQQTARRSGVAGRKANMVPWG